MKTQTFFFTAIIILANQCQKGSSVLLPTTQKPVAILVSTDAVLLDTVWSAPKRYMHFLITFKIIAGDSDMYFSQLPVGFSHFVNIRGKDTLQVYTPYRPMILTNLPETEPESDIYKISKNDTAQISYFGMVIAHGPWTDFYMQAYKFPYSSGTNDGTYESSVEFKQPFTTDRPR